jgi:hypothetical protein
MNDDLFLTLAVFGRSTNDAHLRWIDADSGRCSAGFQCADSAWQWRRRVGDAKLLTENIDGEWTYYAEISRADPGDVEPENWGRYVLREHIDGDEVDAALAHYTDQRVKDGDSLEGRARRLLGPALVKDWGCYSSEAIRQKFKTLHQARRRLIDGRRWVYMSADRRYVELLECSRGANFSRRYLRTSRSA